MIIRRNWTFVQRACIVTRGPLYTRTPSLYAYLVGLKTTAFQRAEALGWSITELAEKSGLSVEMLYKLRAGDRQPGQKAIEGLIRAFPNLSYRDLFVPSDRTQVQTGGLKSQKDLAPAV